MNPVTISLAALAALVGVAALFMRRNRRSQSERDKTEVFRQNLVDSGKRLSSEVDLIGESRRRLTGLIRPIQDQAATVRGHLTELETYLEQAHKRMEAIDELKSSIAQVAGQAESNQRRAQSVIDGLEDQYRGLQSQVGKLNELGVQLGAATEDIDKRWSAMAERNDSLDLILSSLTEGHKDVSVQSQALADAISGIHSQGEKLEEISVSLGRRAENLADVDSELTTHALTLPEQHRQLSADRDLLIDRLRRLSDLATVYETSKQELADEIAERRSTAQRLTDRLSSLEERLSKEEQRHRQTKASLNQEQAALTSVKRELDEANAAKAHLEQRVAELDSAAHARQHIEDLDWHLKPVPKTFDELIDAVRREFGPSVSLPPTAIKDIDEFKSVLGAQQFAADIWRAIGAMHEYATLEPRFNGNFYDWCRHSGHARAYPAGDVALNESDSTKNAKNKDKHSREFYVDAQVSRSGKIAMYAHVKFGGIGQNRPRLFFHDDTRGKTGKIHVGFLGPHNEVKNASSS